MSAGDSRNPFPGPRHYSSDAALTCVERKIPSDRLLTKIESARFILVFGASGSGKSSILHGPIRRHIISRGKKFLLYDQWKHANIQELKYDIVSQLITMSSESILEFVEWFVGIGDSPPHDFVDGVVIFDQLDHLFSPSFDENLRNDILDWLAQTVLNRLTGHKGDLTIIFSVRDDFLGSLLSSPIADIRIGHSYCEIPRMKLNEMISTACLVRPEWVKDVSLWNQLKETSIQVNSVVTNPEINATLAQIVLYQRAENGMLCHASVSFLTVMRNYFISKMISGDLDKNLTLLGMLAKKFVDGRQKRFCSQKELECEKEELGDLIQALPALLAANLITAVGSGSNLAYALVHDSLCDIIKNEYQEAVALAKASEAGEVARRNERENAAVYSQAADRAIATMKEISAASLSYAERHSSQLAGVLKEGRDRELASLRQAHEGQVANLNQLHLAALQREQTAGQLAQRELQQAHKREQEQLKQFHNSQLAQLRQQHVSAVEGVSRALGQQVADTQAESERRASEQQRVLEVIEIRLTQKEAEHAEADKVLAATRQEKDQAEQALTTQKNETAVTLKRGLGWGGGTLLLTLCSAGYGLMRTQTLQATLQVEQVGRKAESAKCKADEASCQQLSQAERRVALAQCLLQKRCGPDGLPGNPNRAASLLREIPASLHSTLPLWSVTAKQILQHGRLRVAELPSDKGVFQGIVYSQTGELLAFFRPEKGNQKVLAVQDEGAAGWRDSDSSPDLRPTALAESSLWRAGWESRLRGWPAVAREFLATVRLKNDAKDCMSQTVKLAPRYHPFSLIRFASDSRVLILTGEGILLRDSRCSGLAGTGDNPEDSLIRAGRLGPYPHQHAVVDEKGTFLVAATESTLRAIAVPQPSAEQASKQDEVLNLDVEGSVLDVRFRPGTSGRLAVVSPRQISFWDLTAAQRPPESELPRFASDCITQQQRQQWLGETAEVASATYDQCGKRHGRKD